MFYGKYSLITTSYASVNIWVFSFCFNHFLCISPVPKDVAPLVVILIFLCTTYAASIHMYISFNIDALIILLSSIVFLFHMINCRIYLHSYSLISDNLVVRYGNSISKYGISLLVNKSSFSVTEWNFSFHIHLFVLSFCLLPKDIYGMVMQWTH